MSNSTELKELGSDSQVVVKLDSSQFPPVSFGKLISDKFDSLASSANAFVYGPKSDSKGIFEIKVRMTQPVTINLRFSGNVPASDPVLERFSFVANGDILKDLSIQSFETVLKREIIKAAQNQERLVEIQQQLVHEESSKRASIDLPAKPPAKPEKTSFFKSFSLFSSNNQNFSAMISHMEIAVVENIRPGEIIKFIFGSSSNEFTNITKLHLEKHELAAFPVEVLKLETLEELYLGHNSIRLIPPEVGKLTKLTTLHLQHNKIEKISKDSLRLLTGLKSLNLAGNRLTSFPEEVCSLTGLVSLNLQHNKIPTVPSDLRGLTMLQKLNLAGNQIKSFKPQTFETLANLKKLYLEDNKLTELPSSFQTLISLEELSIQNNQISSIPSELKNLPRLSILNASHNTLASIPASLATCSSLTSLSFAHNKNIVTLPVELANLASLVRLDCTDNKIDSFPKEFFKLRNLVVLRLGSNNISSLASDVCQLTKLQELIIERNQLTHLPVEIGALVELVDLDLAHNKLKGIPSTIGNLHKLRRLCLNDNQLNHLPPSIGSLSNLVTLRLHNNQELNLFPAEIVYLINVRELSAVNLEINVIVLQQEPPTDMNNNNDLDLDCTNWKKECNVFKEGGPAEFTQLVNLARSGPHHLILAALSYFATQAKYQDKFFEEGVTADLLNIVLKHSDHRTQFEAIKAINILSEQDDLQQKLFQAKCVDGLLAITERENHPQVQSLALKSLGNLLFDETTRQLVYNQIGTELFVNLVKKSQHDHIQRQARRILALFGINDYIEEYGLHPSKKRGIRVLCIDGGGTRGVVSVEILKKLEELTGKKIYELFDLYAGCSTGGILAFGVGINLMDAKKCEQNYFDFCGKIFTTTLETPQVLQTSILSNHWSKLSSGLNILRSGAFYSAEPMEKHIMAEMGEEVMIDTSMDPRTRKVLCVSTLVSTFPPVPYIFRNYNFPIGAKPSRYTGSCRKRPLTAIRATSAAPGYFEEVVDGDKRHQDGGLIANNPTAIALHESQRIWPNRPLACLVSIGTGKEPTKTAKTGIQGIVQTLIECTTSTDRIDEVLSDAYSPDVYYRFNPEHQIFECSLDETKRDKLEEMQAAAREYIEKNISRFEQLATVLK